MRRAPTQYPSTDLREHRHVGRAAVAVQALAGGVCLQRVAWANQNWGAESFFSAPGKKRARPFCFKKWAVYMYRTFSTRNTHPVLTQPISHVWNPLNLPASTF